MTKKFVTLVYIAFVVILFVIYDTRAHSVSESLLNFALPFVGASAFLASYYRREKTHKGGAEILPYSAEIFAEITKANSILLHCHPSPDPDSLGSTLAMKLALESLGKKVTLIKGDSEIPAAFAHFPGAGTIEQKSFGEVDLTQFNLFIILDSGSPEMVSRKQPPVFPLSIKSIVIDHHASNKGYADLNLVTPAISTTFILYKLFKTWNIQITPDIASNLFIGMYTDTGGFKYPPTDHKVFEVVAELVKIIPNFIELISKMDNSQSKEFIYGQALALSSIQTFHNDHLAISAVSYQALADKKIVPTALSEGHIANIVKSVVGWDIAVSAVEVEPGKVKISFRSIKYDVSKLAVALGGGGHKAAAGAVLTTTLDQAILKVVETSKVLYNL